jgi:nickel transport protein
MEIKQMKCLFFLKPVFFKYFLSFLLALLFVFSAETTSAHRVVVFAWIEGDTVFTQSRFPDGRNISNGQVNVFDPDDNLLLDGKTDTNGEFSFKIPKPASLNIVLNAGMGHQGEWKLSEDEIKSALGISGKKSEFKNNDLKPNLSKNTKNKQPKPLLQNAPVKTAGKSLIINEKQLNQIVEKAVDKSLDKKLKPVTRILSRMQDTGPSVHDIFSGIGYILGLMGIAAYFLSKKKSD